MSAQTPLPKDDPIMKAWERFQTSDEYRNAFNWCALPAHRPGALWAAFLDGWFSAKCHEANKDL